MTIKIKSAAMQYYLGKWPLGDVFIVACKSGTFWLLHYTVFYLVYSVSCTAL